jgi:pre-mRNA-splicing factor 18
MRSLTPDTRNKDPKSVSPGPSSHDATTPTPDAQHKDINLSSEEITLRLRSKGQPIRLFGETERERGLRLRAVELIEEKGLEKAHGGNDFRRIMEDVELKGRQLERDAKVKEGKEGEGAAGAEGSGPRQLTEKEKRRLEVESAGPLDLSLLKTKEGKEKVYPMIYWAMKKVLKEWEQYLEDRPG